MAPFQASSPSANGMRSTDTHTFFWHSILSNWHQGPSFSGNIALRRAASQLQAMWIPIPSTSAISSRLILKHSFNCGEQFMMACKAWLFDQDPKASVLRSILASKKPYEQKALGRKVPGFIDSIWQAASFGIVVASQVTRAEADRRLAEIYLSSNKIFVEGSPKDKIWGVGLHWEDATIEDERNWLGENRLGWCHGIARRIFREEKRIQLLEATTMRTRTSTHSSSDSDGGVSISESLDIHGSTEISALPSVSVALSSPSST
jgi:ribA/ribD-fused uncharacterized protein